VTTVVEVVHARGDAFESFYATHRGTVARALSVTLRNPELAAEATDEAMSRAYARWSTVQTYENPAGWVYRVGLNWAHGVVRRRMRPRRVLHESDITQGATPRDPDLHRALASLDVERRAVVVCRYLLGLSESEIAEVLNIRPGTVKSRLSRGLEQLERALRERPDPPRHDTTPSQERS
jgi:RNA polymerase sigma factor (sigma-70 family)